MSRYLELRERQLRNRIRIAVWLLGFTIGALIAVTIIAWT